MVERAERQQMQTRTLAAKRGDIVDRKGRVLATSVDADTIYAVPSAIDDEDDDRAPALRGARRLHGEGTPGTRRPADDASDTSPTSAARFRRTSPRRWRR